MKTCRKCQRELTTSEFHRDGNSGDGLRARCRDCRSLDKSDYLSRRPHVGKAYRERYHLLNFRTELLNLARRRAAKKGLKFNLDIADIVAPTHCPVLGIKLRVTSGGGIGRTPDYAPTLDRIDRSMGYVKGNVAVISWRANRMKAHWSKREIVALASWLTRLSRTVKSSGDQLEQLAFFPANEVMSVASGI